MRLWLLICNVGRACGGGLLSLEPEARVTYPGKEGTHKPISRGQVQQGGEGGTEGTAAVILLLGTSRRGEATMQAGACHAMPCHRPSGRRAIIQVPGLARCKRKSGDMGYPSNLI